MTPEADSFAHAPVAEAPSPGVRPRAPDDRAAEHLAAVAEMAALARGLAGAAGLPLAEAATVLWTRFHKFDAADPGWPDRDRFLVSDADSAILRPVLQQLSGHAGRDLGEADGSDGGAGHGLGHAVGLALAERLLAARFGRSLVDHRTWLVAGEADLTGGLGHEAACLAGHLKLGRLAVLWDATGEERGDGHGDVARRFAACGWTVRRVDGGDPADIAASLALAMRSTKPTLLACSTTDTPPLASAPVAGNAARNAAGEEAPVARAWAASGSRGSGARRAWLKRLARHALRPEFERVTAARLPDPLHEALENLRASLAGSRPAMATRAASEHVLAAIAPALPELVADTVALGVNANGAALARRRHGTAAALNGLALHGGLIPHAGSFVLCSDDMRPALRMAALTRQRVIHVLTRDGGDGGEEGPTHQAVEQLASLRAMPNLHVFRPADAIETAECWDLALRRHDGPSVLALSRQPVPSLRPPGPAGENRAARGGYVLAEAEGGRHATLIATGPEVATAMAARETLRAEGIRVAVVSLPCWELFARADPQARDAVLGTAPRIGIEAAGDFGWSRWIGPDGVFVGFRAPDDEAWSRQDWTAQPRPIAADVIAAVRQCLSPTGG